MRTVNPRPTVVLADDHAGILESASRLLASDYDILATVTDGRKAVEAVLRLTPDVAVLDIAMPELDGFGAAREVRESWSDTRIVFLTVHDDEDFINAALATGVVGYVLKPFMQTDLVHAIADALEGRVFVSSHASHTSRQHLRQ
jgi:DNA-binding NarL/FixJ family response regulator